MKLNVGTAFFLYASRSAFHAFSPVTIRAVRHREAATTVWASDFSDFHSLLQESSEVDYVPPPSSRRIALSSDGARKTVFTSAVVGSSPVAEEEALEEFEDVDPYAENIVKAQTYQEQPQTPEPLSMKEKLVNMDIQDLFLTIFIPAVALVGAGRWGYDKVSGIISSRLEDTLEAFARDMIYHDGKPKKMELCVTNFSKQLMLLGPRKTDAMLKSYLGSYAKTIAITPQSIVSISYAFSIFGVSEHQAASVMVSTCRQLGQERLNALGKIFFLGSRILKSPEAVAALSPIKALIVATYESAEVGEEMMDSQQQLIAEAAYQSVVQDGGKDQSELTDGWEVLGLDKDTATRIFKEEASEGFKKDAETFYEDANVQFNDKGLRLNEDGSLQNPKEAEAEPEDEGPVSNVYECSRCGYTMFIAEGRESKFFGEGFTCPECGAPKDEFNAREDDE